MAVRYFALESGVGRKQGAHGERKRTDPVTDSHVTQHIIRKIPQTAHKIAPTKRCRVCYEKSIRKDIAMNAKRALTSPVCA